MDQSRPPSYSTTIDLDGISRVVALSTDSPTSSTSSSTAFDDFDDFYDPSSEKYAEDLKRAQKKVDRRAAVRVVSPRRNQTAPAAFGAAPNAATQTGMQRPLPTEKRPRPKVARITTSSPRTINYSFISSTTGNNSTTLVPNVTEENDLKRYTVNVSMNCFMPSSFITKVYHNTTKLIGEFEMGLISNGVSSKVRIGQQILAISDVLSKSGGREAGSWFWNPFGMKEELFLKWDYSTRPCMCYSTIGEKTILAKFTSPYGLNETNEPAILEVLPAGQEASLFEHILLFLLIVERKRLTPDRGSVLKPLFN